MKLIIRDYFYDEKIHISNENVNIEVFDFIQHFKIDDIIISNNNKFRIKQIEKKLEFNFNDPDLVETIIKVIKI